MCYNAYVIKKGRGFVKIKDIEKNLPITFIEADKNREVPDLEYAQTIKNAYINQLKYASLMGRRNPKYQALVDAYENINARPIELAKVTSVNIIENAFLNRREFENEFNNFFVIELENNYAAVFNLTTGENLTLDYNNSLGLVLNKTKIYKLYNHHNEDFKTNFSLNQNVTITLYEKCNLINDINNEEIGVSSYLLINDTDNNQVIVDVLHNHLYTRNNYSIKKEKKTKSLLIFQTGTPSNFKLSYLKVPGNILK